MTLPIRPKRGGFLRLFGCGWFIWEFLLGNGPYGSPKIDPSIGAPQADIFFHYKNAIRLATALDRATRMEEKRSRVDRRPIDPDNIERLTEKLLDQMPYKAHGCRFHSFVVYFTNPMRLGWVEFTGREEPSAFQDHYPQGNPRRYYRLTKAGIEASHEDWKNPQRVRYGRA